MKFTEVVKRVRELARVREAAASGQVPASGPYSHLRPEMAGKTAERDSGECLFFQPAAAVYGLAIVMIVGQGRLSPRADLLGYYANLGDHFKQRDLARILIQQPRLADDLTRGLKRLAGAGVGLDALFGN